MRRIVLVQEKGGAAKTTLCVHLAVAAEQAGFKTAIIDTDPQGSASAVWGAARGRLRSAAAASAHARVCGPLAAALLGHAGLRRVQSGHFLLQI